MNELDELDAVVAMAAGASECPYEPSIAWILPGTLDLATRPAKDWRFLMAAVGKLEDTTGLSFQRDRDGSWEVYDDFGNCLFAMPFDDESSISEAEALARCIRAAVEHKER